jgi:hypothetical protein
VSSRRWAFCMVGIVVVMIALVGGAALTQNGGDADDTGDSSTERGSCALMVKYHDRWYESYNLRRSFVHSTPLGKARLPRCGSENPAPRIRVDAIRGTDPALVLYSPRYDPKLVFLSIDPSDAPPRIRAHM